MIPRYTRPEMAAIWTDEARFSLWLEIETAALEAMVAEGLAPKESLDAVRSKGGFDSARVLEIEAEVKHDVIAFLTCVSERVGPAGRFLHRGMTSSDVLDTAFAVQLKQSGALILKGLTGLKDAIRVRALEFKDTPCIGRSHGIHAEPTTFGLKLLGWYSELDRAGKRLESAIEEVSAGKIAGAVGTYASVSPAVEAHVMKRLGLIQEAVPTQIVSRDRHASFFTALALLASSLERFATEVRHLQRSEVREVEEPFGSGQKGSSAMPHKRNPILCENLCGLARLVRSYAFPAMENVALWHERDISHSSVERISAPDACELVDFMLARFTGVVRGMRVYPERMLENLRLTRGIFYSGTLLLALVDAGMVREEAYRLVQKHALAAWDEGGDFETRVRSEPSITNQLGKKRLDEVFDMKRHLRHADTIFKRVLHQDD